jgi:anti-anti-sigma factor
LAPIGRISVQPPNPIVVELAGELDLATVPRLKYYFDRAMRVSPVVTVDLAEVTFLDASVIGALVEARQQALSEGGELFLRGASPWIWKVLHSAQVDEAIPMAGPAGEDASGPAGRLAANSLAAALGARRKAANPLADSPPLPSVPQD